MLSIISYKLEVTRVSWLMDLSGFFFHHSIFFPINPDR